MMDNKDYLPLVYSCSGCSNVAQLANLVAVNLDRKNIAEMSCIAGIGGHVSSLVKKAKSGRDIIALDGCHLQCVKNCLGIHDVKPTLEFILTEHNFKKAYQTDFDETEALALVADVILAIDKLKRSQIISGKMGI